MIAHHQFLLPQSHDLSPNNSLKTRKIILLNNGTKQNINSSINYDKGNQHKTIKFFASNLETDNGAQSQKLKHQIADPPKFDPSLNYSREFWKMYLQNEIIVSEIRQSVAKSKETMSVIKCLETECKELEASLPGHSKRETKKKKRRTANEIKKSFVCPYQNCNKNYGSDVSLNLHIKLKHNGGNKTEREKLARDIFLAKINGEEQPEIKLNLPPGFLDNVNKTKLLKEKCTRRDQSVKSEKDSQNNFEENRSSDSNMSENIDTKESTEPIVMHEIKIHEIPSQCGESS